MAELFPQALRMTATPLKICNYVIISAPVLFIAGMVTVFFGSGQTQIVRVGTGVSLFGVASFLLGLGSRSLSVAILAAQGCGFRVIRERPFYSAAWILFSLVLVGLGIGLLYLVVTKYFL